MLQSNTNQAYEGKEGGGDQALPSSISTVTFAPHAPPPAERFEFDQVFTVKHDDDIGKPKQTKQMNLGALRTTTSKYGTGCDVPQKMSKNVRNKSTSQFFNSGHLRVNEDAD